MFILLKSSLRRFTDVVKRYSPMIMEKGGFSDQYIRVNTVAHEPPQYGTIRPLIIVATAGLLLFVAGFLAWGLLGSLYGYGIVSYVGQHLLLDFSDAIQQVFRASISHFLGAFNHLVQVFEYHYYTYLFLQKGLGASISGDLAIRIITNQP